MIARKLHFIYHWELVLEDNSTVCQPKIGVPSEHKNVKIIKLISHSKDFPSYEYIVPPKAKTVYFKRNVLKCNTQGTAIPVSLTYNIGYEKDGVRHLKYIDVLTKEIDEISENI